MSAHGGVTGPRDLVRLFRLWLNEQDDPRTLYTELAERAVTAVEARNGPLAGQRIADLGCGPGYYSAALRRRGADVLPIDASEEELRLAGEPPEGAIVADAMDLPLEAASLDGVFSSNMLEHVPDTRRVLDEMARVVRPGGWAYLSWTNFFSPWGGHDMTPYHLLGRRAGLRAYRRRHDGRTPKNALGISLFPVHVGPTLRLLRDHPDLQVEHVEPRYWPQLHALARVPGLREVAMWNCVVWLRRVPPL